MADDELRKGQRGAVACVDLIYRRKKRRRLLSSIAPHHPGSLRFHPLWVLLRDSVGLHDVVRLEVVRHHVRKSLLRKLSKILSGKTQLTKWAI